MDDSYLDNWLARAVVYAEANHTSARESQTEKLLLRGIEQHPGAVPGSSRKCLGRSSPFQVNDRCSQQVAFTVRYADLGNRSAVDLGFPAYLASVHSCTELVSQIVKGSYCECRKYNWTMVRGIWR